MSSRFSLLLLSSFSVAQNSEVSIVAASMAAHNKNYGVYNVENGVVFYFDLDIIQQDDGEPEMIPENSADNTSEQ